MNCFKCPFESQTVGDLKQYPIDRQNVIEYITGSGTANADNFELVCKKCFEDYNKLEEFGFNMMGTKFTPITWDDPYGKNHKPVQNIIIQTITNNYITNNYDNSNLTNNNTSNNTNNITNNNYITKNDNNNTKNDNNDPMFVKRSRKTHETLLKEFEFNRILRKEQEEEELRLLQIESDKLQKEKELQWQEKQRKISYEAELRKEVNNKIRDRRCKEIVNTKLIYTEAKDFPDYYKKDMKEYRICNKCDVLHAYPYGFTSSRNKIIKGGIICRNCLGEKTDKKQIYKDEKTINCECGCKYIATNPSIIEEHEASDRHLKNLKRNIGINGVNYGIPQLRKICNLNNIKNYFKMNKATILENLFKLEEIKIPEDL